MSQLESKSNEEFIDVELHKEGDDGNFSGDHRNPKKILWGKNTNQFKC